MQKQTIITIFALMALVGLIVAGYFAPKERINQPEESAVLSPREVVEKFIEADMAGARIGGDIAKQAPEIEQYFTFSSIDDLVMVINKYEIVDEYPSKYPNKYFVKVKYFCAEGIAPGFTGIEGEKVIQEVPGENAPGVIVSVPCESFLEYMEYIYPLHYLKNTNKDPSIILDMEQGTETIIFELTKFRDWWKIDSSIILPHISEKTLIRHLNNFKY